jgi:hypothetical protein
VDLSDPAKLKAQRTYDAAADAFDARPLGFWAIEQLGPDAEQARQAIERWARETHLAAIETNVTYAVATRA